ncbi:helix-turn-helix domain-containing protein [Ekhidna sp.]|uniref:helix-turn-helix domain-containing protein n=1 Tax=Ekhidna sp. TaxID=2608089 RepID=UPI00329686D8
MEVICMQEDAFYALVEKVVERVDGSRKAETSKWLDGEEAMKYLRIKSKSTLQKLRDEGKIKFSQPQKKHILYDSDSLNTYLENNAQVPFEL